MLNFSLVDPDPVFRSRCRGCAKPLLSSVDVVWLNTETEADHFCSTCKTDVKEHGYRVCPNCGDLFYPETPGQTHCGDLCRSEESWAEQHDEDRSRGF